MVKVETGPKNLITDVPGLMVGNAQDSKIKTGVSVLVGDQPFTAGVHVMGGAPGTRETDLLAPDKLVEQVEALVLSGGSSFGLDAGSGVADELSRAGRGYPVGSVKVPVVPGAIIFDLLNGGQKDWQENPYKELGAEAFAAKSDIFEIGSVGAGTGATTANLKGGLGSASAVLPNGVIVGALIAVNAIGSVVVDDGSKFWAAPFEIDGEFGGLGMPSQFNSVHLPATKHGPSNNTTIGIVATNAALTKAQCTRMAIAAHDGIARAVVPAHTPKDGDLIFAASTGAIETEDHLLIGHMAANCVARAIARGVHAAESVEGDTLPTWQSLFG
ncbi:MAG: P1 family peptidase [Pseudomonadota bacterium]